MTEGQQLRRRRTQVIAWLLAFHLFLAVSSLAAQTAVQITGQSPAPDGDMEWWYRQPARNFWEGLPLGTGRFGAMVFGEVRDETIVFNDQTLWTGSPYDPVNPNGIAALPEIRKAVLEGKYFEAGKLSDTNLLSYPYPHVQNYQAMGRLLLQFAGHDEVADYRRELDMDSAMARVRYRIGDVLYQREIFASHPDQVVVIRLCCAKPGRLTLKVRFDSIQPSAASRTEGGDELVMDGGTIEQGGVSNLMKWESRVRLITHGGTVLRSVLPGGNANTRACLVIENADDITLILAGATNYKHWDDISADPSARCQQYLKCGSLPYEELKRRHLEDYQPRFRACRLNLGKTDAARQEDTTTRLRAKRENDPLLVAQYFQYGRYLLLAGAREDALAFNNHNIWLDDLDGRWRGRWTLNINIQECYWPVENTSLAELNGSLLRFVQDLSETGRRTARKLYGCRGWCAHHGTDIWMNTAPTDGEWGMSPNMGAWLCLQLWQHYLFEMDANYLRQIYPLLKGAAQFGLDISIEEPTHHWLVTCPSASPENAFYDSAGKKCAVGMGATIDNQILRDLFNECIQASRALGVDASLRSELEKAVQRIPPEQIGKYGQVQEWLSDFEETDPTHRHLSSLVGFYPCSEMTRRGTPALAAAVRQTLQRRGNSGPGWSWAWKINLWARLGDGERAWQYVQGLVKQTSDSDRVPSIEGNQGIQGFTAGIAEMLVQSHAGEIELLPALPKAWRSGAVEGLRARGGFQVDMNWDGGGVTRAVIRSKLGSPCRIRCSTPLRVQADGQPAPATLVEPSVLSFETKMNKTYTLVRAN